MTIRLQPMESTELKPDFPFDKAPREYTFRAFILATLLTVIFGAAAGYLGLKIGMTFAASIPASVMALAVLRGLFRDSTALESNIVQTQASSGEGLMGAVVYMVPALIFLGLEPSGAQIVLMSLAGGLLGVFILVPLRHYLIVVQHRALPFPEGTACANILRLGEKTSVDARYIFTGFGIGGLYNLLTADGLRLFSAQLSFSVQRLCGLTVGIHLTPLMLGVGFLVGPGVGLTMLGGALLKGVVILPVLNCASGWAGSSAFSEEQVQFYVRLIGAGAVATGGFLAILKMLPQFVAAVKSAVGGLRSRESTHRVPRIHQDVPIQAVVLVIAVALGLSLWALVLGIGRYGFPSLVTLILALLLISVLGFLFVTLCARLVGILGTSSYPLSGMTISALLAAVAVLRLSGLSGEAGMMAALVIGTTICVAIAICADMSQDLKTGALLGATPYRQQIAQAVGALITAFVAVLVIMLFQESGELDRLPAPQARMMAAIVQSVMTDQFQWLYVGIGVGIAIVAELIGISSILLAVGLYLPVPLASAFILGGAVRGLFDRRHAGSEQKEGLERRATLLASGLIGGWAVIGVLLVAFVALREFGAVNFDLGVATLPQPGFSLAYFRDLIFSLTGCAVVIYYFGRVTKMWGKSKNQQPS
ncbi:MAG: OPT family oligopeptide transporter [Acidobacteriota bacterium]